MLTFLIPAFAAPPTTAKFSTSLASDTVAAFRTIDEAKNHGLKIADAYLKQQAKKKNRILER